MGKGICYLLTLGFALSASLVSSAQLVNDGGTNTLDGVATTLPDQIAIGTNGPFTFLLLTNAATLTNSGTAYIGQNVTARSNAVVVTGAGSVWNPQGTLNVGNIGNANALSILDGAMVTNRNASIGVNANNNQVVVSGTNSSWLMQWTVSSTYGILRVGSSGSRNTLVITNGGKVADGFAYIGENTSAASNSVIVTGAGSTWSHLTTYHVGNNGSWNNLLITNGGAVTGGVCNLGFLGSNNVVTVTGTNSLWSVGRVSLGNAGTSAFNEVQVRDGAKVAVAGTTVIGQYTFSNTICVSDPGTFWTNGSYLEVGYNGRGNQLIVSNGAVVNVDYTQVEANGGFAQKVIITGAGSLLTNRTGFFLGYSGGSNQLLVADGGRLVNTIGYVGYGGGNAISNQAIITGTNSVWTNRSNLYIGYNDARSLLVISNGGKVFNELGVLGDNSAGSNTVFVTDPGSLWSCRQELLVGFTGSGNQLSVSNGGMVVAQSFTLGNSSASSNNLLTVNGGTVIVTNLSGGFYVQRGTATMNFGLLNVYRLQMNNGPSGKLNLNGGLLRALNATVNNGTNFIVGDGTNAATYVMANNQLTTGTHSFNNGLVVSSNALLTGVGTLSGNVFIRAGGTIAPGSANILHMTVNSSLVLSNGSFTACKLNAQSGQCNRFIGSGNYTFGGTLQLTNEAGTLAHGMSFKLFTGSSYQGAFSAITPATPGPGRKWNTNQLTVDGTLRVFNVNAAPPPIASVERSASDLLINATGGIPYDPCYVLTSTNLIDWQYGATNSFDAAGNVAITNVISLDEPARFYRLQVE